MPKPSTTLFIATLIIACSFSLDAQTENCTNGLDDDNDGLIDCYDTDCTCTGQCDDFYYTTCNADCYYVPPCTAISLAPQWTSTAETGTYSTLVAGDLDGDGIPEVVTYRVEANNLYIIDGATGATKVEILTQRNLAGGTAPAIADLDKDGFGEIVIVDFDRYLLCYEHDGTLKYSSTVQVGYNDRYRFAVPNIADFDHDGWPEVNIGNQVYNGQTGALIASGGLGVSAGEHPARVNGGFSFCSPVAIDALPDAFCPDCDGLEIVAGNQVLSVNLATGAVTPVVTAPSQFSDGFTTVCDFDRDGDLDAIVQGRRNGWNTVYCWEIETPTIMRQYQLINNWFDAASRVNVADLNGDGDLEISFVGFPRLYALRNNFTTLWINSTNDVSSITCSSVFDFCGDGSADVVYRGQSFLQIIEGATGAIKWQDACISLTHIENPLILDVDNDGQTEIVIECGTDPSGAFGNVVAYEAVGSPGIASRKVWNQHAYFNTNINDDLSVPQYQQNPHIIGDSLKMNTFLNQYFNPSFPSPDGVLTLNSAVCDRDSIVIELEICNIGDNVLPAQTLIAAYKGNPQQTQAQWIGAVPIGQQVTIGTCNTYQIKIPLVANDSIFIVLNDDNTLAPPYSLAQDFPVTAIGECGFLNNIGKFYIDYNPGLLNLGSDTSICANTTLLLDATGNQFSTWSWQNNTTMDQLTTSGEGLYHVTITDVCFNAQMDSIVVAFDTTTIVDLGPDQAICKGEVAILSEDHFDEYTWSPANVLNCSTCAQVEAGPSVSGPIFVEARRLLDNCINRDTIYLTVNDTFNYAIDTIICLGREVVWNNVTIPPDSNYTFYLQTIHGCDSTVTVRVKGTDIGTYLLTVDTAVCINELLPYNNVNLAAGEEKTFYLSSIAGCDSTVMVRVGSLDTFTSIEYRTICYGESSTIFGTPQSVSGVYSFVYKAENGCDSTHWVRLDVLPEIELIIATEISCFDTPTGSLTLEISGAKPPYFINWDILGADNKLVVKNLLSGTYNLILTDSNECTQTASAFIEAYPPIVFEVFPDSVRCFGESNGSITITSNDPTLTFGLDGNSFSQQLVYPGLPAATYEVFAEDAYGCIDTLPATILQPPAISFNLPDDAVLNLGDSIQLSITLAGNAQPVSFVWNDTTYLSCGDCPDPWVKPLRSKNYILEVRDLRGCVAYDDWSVSVTRFINAFIPNIFNPTVGEPNNQLIPNFGSAIKSVRYFQIFNRWGEMVFEARNAQPNTDDLHWDGKHRGRVLDPGVLTWAMEIELTDGVVEKLYGDVTIIR